MISDPFLFNLFSMCDDKHCFAFQVIDEFGDKLTLEEMEYWMAFNVMRTANMYSINYRHLTYDETVKKINAEKTKRKEKSWKNRKK